MPILRRDEAVEEEAEVLDGDLPFAEGAGAVDAGVADFAGAAVAVVAFVVVELEAATIPTTEFCALLCSCVTTLVDRLAFGKNMC